MLKIFEASNRASLNENTKLLKSLVNCQIPAAGGRGGEGRGDGGGGNGGKGGGEESTGEQIFRTQSSSSDEVERGIGRPVLPGRS